MKRHIRRGVFETNSSSTHSLTVCSEDEFEAWKRGELLLDEWNGQFVSAVDLSDYDKQMAKEKYCKTKDEFQKDWDDLSESAKQKYYTHFVKENDIVYHLGDFSFGGKDNVEKFLKKLNGKIILVKGNHDRYSNGHLRRIGFYEVYDRPIVIDNKIILSHGLAYFRI